MKKIIVSFSLLMTSGLSIAFANDKVNPDQQILEGFKKEFIAAQSITWDKQGEYDRAIFLLMGHRVMAWFNTTGQLEGCIRDIFFDQLPLNVMKAVDKRFAEADILSVREITNADGTNYQITLETKSKKLNVKVGLSGSIEEVDKLTK